MQLLGAGNAAVPSRRRASIPTTWRGARSRDGGHCASACGKDRIAIARRFSVQLGEEAGLARLTAPGFGGRLEVLEVSRHRNKLRLGHLRGNRFRLGLEGADEPGAVEMLRVALERLSLHGVANRFGEQRFGAGGVNLAIARAWAAGDVARAAAFCVDPAGRGAGGRCPAASGPGSWAASWADCARAPTIRRRRFMRRGTASGSSSPRPRRARCSTRCTTRAPRPRCCTRREPATCCAAATAVCSACSRRISPMRASAPHPDGSSSWRRVLCPATSAICRRRPSTPRSASGAPGPRSTGHGSSEAARSRAPGIAASWSRRSSSRRSSSGRRARAAVVRAAARQLRDRGARAEWGRRSRIMTRAT